LIIIPIKIVSLLSFKLLGPFAFQGFAFLVPDNIFTSSRSNSGFHIVSACE